jgi:membrane-bound lytic murein transglycosylase D
MRESERVSASGIPVLVVRLSDGRVLRCSRSFHIGRDAECEVRVQDVHVSRRHAEVIFANGHWSIRDLQSSNGLFVGGEPVETAPIGEGISVALGSEGPSLRIEPESGASRRSITVPAIEPTPADDPKLLERYAERYFGSGDSKAGDRTLMIRKAFQQLQQRQKRRHRMIVGALTLAVLSAVVYGWYQYQQLAKQNEIARELFYTMKAIDVHVAEVEQKLAESGNASLQQSLAKDIQRRRQMEAQYRQYVRSLYDRRLSEKDRLILEVTRIFGECEIAAPPDYIQEVSRYIDRWKSTGRFARAVKLARERGYTKTIVDQFLAKDLPSQYFYLGMQESDFLPFRSGPPTRWGIAKGMWQFIPETGKKYGLTIGRLKDSPQVDLGDERLDWRKATGAAASYVKDLYATDAQASGLLVIASYNWGERRVIDILRKMPENPRDRNFWKLLEKHRDQVPGQTYDYVFSIVSAAVIGENPRLFGFDFDNPLLEATRQSPPVS